jgi:EAL domain-containing protein (putative c-di-GMP-specific phosphodiesterase class I)
LGERLSLSYQTLRGADHTASYEWQKAYLTLPNHPRPVPLRLLLEQLQDNDLSWQFDSHRLHLATQRLAEHRQEETPRVILVTLSNSLLLNPGLIQQLRDELRAHRMTGTGLILSFDTSQALSAGESAQEAMQAFKPLGVRICFRNFHGTPAHLLGIERLQPFLVAPSSTLIMKAEQRAIDLIAYNLAKLSVGICLLADHEHPIPQTWRRIAKLGTD